MHRSKKTKSNTNEISIEKKPKSTIESSVSAHRVLFGIIAVSLLSVPVCYMLSYMKQMKDSSNIFLYSTIICISVAPLTYFLLIKHLLHVQRETYFYVFTIFSFTAVADSLLALTILDYSSAFHFYLEQGEVYLKTAHGLFINIWDGTTHFLLYLIMLYCMLIKRTETKFYRFVSLFWCGSIINSLIVLVGGAAVGQFGKHIKPSCLLNIPYMLFPTIYLFRQLNLRTHFLQQEIKDKEKKRPIRKSFLLCLIDMFFIVYLMFGIAFAIFRAFHTLKTPLTNQSVYFEYEPYLSNTSGFPLVQLLVYAFYFIPYYVAAIVALFFYHQQPSKYPWLPDWTMVHAGAAAQAQFSYLCSSLHDPPLFPDASWSAIPADYWSITVTLNLLLAIVPQLLAFRVCFANRDRDFY